MDGKRRGLRALRSSSRVAPPIMQVGFLFVRLLDVVRFSAVTTVMILPGCHLENILKPAVPFDANSILMFGVGEPSDTNC